MNKLNVTFYLSLMILPFSVSANNFNVGITSNDILYLEGPNCEELNLHARQICNWESGPNSTNRNIAATYTNKSCVKQKNKLFKINVDSACIPNTVKEVVNKNLSKDGPNCWGTSMSLHKLSTKPRFVWPQEIRYWHESTPLCRKLSKNETPKAGDLLNVYSPEYLFDYDIIESDAGNIFWNTLYPNRLPPLNKYRINSYSGFHRILHTDTFITDKIVYGKDSPSKLDKFTFKNIINTYGRPRNEADCQENQELEPYFREYNNAPKNVRASKCAYFTQVYRCENILDYLESKKENLKHNELLKEIQSLDKMNTQLFSELFTAKVQLTSTEIEILKAYSKNISLDARNSLSQKGISKYDEMIHTQRYFSAEAILKQLSFLNL